MNFTNILGPSGPIQAEQMPEMINALIKDSEVDTNLISDGYHTFGELYAHRIELFITLCRKLSLDTTDIRRRGFVEPIWRSKRHYDLTEMEGWFIMGIGKDKGKQITYHLPMSYWEKTHFAETLTAAPEYDGHTSDDALKRMINL